jgi:guanylate kinase
MLNKKNHYFVLSSPSGGGKTTLLKALFKKISHIRLSISMTTRDRRPDEVEGRDYFFVNEDEFRRKIDAGELLEWEEVHGHLYGTPQYQIHDDNEDLIFDVDTCGALRLRELFPNTTLIFIQAPSAHVLEERLRARGTESPEDIAIRLENFKKEMLNKDRFDYVVVNDRLEDAVDRLVEIIHDVRQQ